MTRILLNQRPLILLALACVLCFALASSASAGEVEKTYDFELGKWVELNSEEGPVILHRFQLARDSGGLKKSRLLRPGRNSEYMTDIEIRLEYTNDSSHDWKVDIDVEWLDSDGETIDGYRSKEQLDEGERHEIYTAQQATSSYGLDKAQKVRLKLVYYPE